MWAWVVASGSSTSRAIAVAIKDWATGAPSTLKVPGNFSPARVLHFNVLSYKNKLDTTDICTLQTTHMAEAASDHLYCKKTDTLYTHNV